MADKAESLVTFIQERCLWQFVSRAPDREENIDGVLTLVGILLTGGAPKLQTPMDRLHFANANHLATEIKSEFPWLTHLGKEELFAVVTGAIKRIHEITVKKSKNGELHLPAY
jgi:V-containing nitrogenase delta subunit